MFYFVLGLNPLKINRTEVAYSNLLDLLKIWYFTQWKRANMPLYIAQDTSTSCDTFFSQIFSNMFILKRLIFTNVKCLHWCSPSLCNTDTHTYTQAFCSLGQRVRQSPVGGHFFTRQSALGVMAPFDKKRDQKKGREENV